MRLVLRGIQAGKIPRDSEARLADERGWRDLMDVVVAVASALLEPELGEPLDLTDEEKTLIGESPFAQKRARSSVRPARPPPLPPPRQPPAARRGPRR